MQPAEAVAQKEDVDDMFKHFKNSKREKYACADNTKIAIPRKEVNIGKQWCVEMVYSNHILYDKNDPSKLS